MQPGSRRPWRQRASDPTRLIGGTKRRERHLLVYGRGVPLSFVATGANRHDVSQFDEVLQAIFVRRKMPIVQRRAHLCADYAYRGAPALEIIESHGYIPRVVGRSAQAQAKRQDPTKKARRWVVEVCHAWFDRFRKSRVR